MADSYAFLSVTDADGNTLLSYDVIGSQNQPAKPALPAGGGEVIHLRVRRAGQRSAIVNDAARRWRRRASNRPTALPPIGLKRIND
ncbi:hypothetical protein M8494_18625 [Serratia ureilytica]